MRILLIFFLKERKKLPSSFFFIHGEHSFVFLSLPDILTDSHRVNPMASPLGTLRFTGSQIDKTQVGAGLLAGLLQRERSMALPPLTPLLHPCNSLQQSALPHPFLTWKLTACESSFPKDLGVSCETSSWGSNSKSFCCTSSHRLCWHGDGFLPSSAGHVVVGPLCVLLLQNQRSPFSLTIKKV